MVSDGLISQTFETADDCLNPTFSGTWSLTSRKKQNYQRRWKCLNPTFSGTWSLTVYLNVSNVELTHSLNPTFSGTWSLTQNQKSFSARRISVLILLFLEHGLWQKASLSRRSVVPSVLILLFLEHGLWHYSLSPEKFEVVDCLNPTFSGTWSLTSSKILLSCLSLKKS